MSQILVRPEHLSGDQFKLEGPEAHHVLRVLRKKEGDSLTFFDGQGTRFQGVISKAGSASIEGRITERLSSPKKSTVVRLFQGLPKGSKIDYIIEKAVELGADEIIPFLSEKSLIKLDGKQAASKQARWARLAQAAAKQCDRSSVPVISEARPLKDWSGELKDGLTLVFTTDFQASSLRNLWNGQAPAQINLVIGPESGFSKAELYWLVSNGGKPVTLGSSTLRTETAGLAALAVINFQLGYF